MTVVLLSAGIARRDERILLVASRYPSHAQPLWNLPGGRVELGESYGDAVVREIHEETGLRADVLRLAYVSESYDRETHFIAVVFEVSADGEIVLPQRNDHVVDARWCTRNELCERLHVAILREPLLRYLESGERYFATRDAGVTVRWDPPT